MIAIGRSTFEFRVVYMKKAIAVLMTIMLCAAMLAACSSGGGGNSTMSQPAPMPSYSADHGEYNSYGADVAPAEFSLMSRPEEGGNTAYSTQSLSGLSETPDDISAMGIADMSDKIIYSATAELETVDFDATIEQVYDLLNFNNAFIESSYIGGRNYAQSSYAYRQQTYRSANFTLRVPKDRFETVTGGLDILGNVTSLRTNAVNITAQFFDTQSRLSSYRIQEERLLAMLERADEVTDMIAIESRLSELRYSIESLTSTLLNWQSQVDYSTLTIYITEVEIYTEIVPIQRSYWEQIGDGFQATVRGVGRFFSNLFMWIIINLPALAIFAAFAIIALIIGKRTIRRFTEKHGTRISRRIKRKKDDDDAD